MRIFRAYIHYFRRRIFIVPTQVYSKAHAQKVGRGRNFGFKTLNFVYYNKFKKGCDTGFSLKKFGNR